MCWTETDSVIDICNLVLIVNSNLPVSDSGLLRGKFENARLEKINHRVEHDEQINMID